MVRVQYKWVGGLTSRLEPYTPPSSTTLFAWAEFPARFALILFLSRGWSHMRARVNIYIYIYIVHKKTEA